MAQVEIYNKDGTLILSSDSKVLTGTYLYGRMHPNNFDKDLFNKEETLNVGGESFSYLSLQKSNKNNHEDLYFWLVLDNNSCVFLADPEATYCVRTNSNYIRMYCTYLRNLNEYEGYFNVYNQSGDLMWSIESIVQAPKIIGNVFLPANLSFNSSVEIDLNRFNVDINKIGVLPTISGRSTWDESFVSFLGVTLERNNNILKVTPRYSLNGNWTSNYTVGTIFGEDGATLLLGYLPNS